MCLGTNWERSNVPFVFFSLGMALNLDFGLEVERQVKFGVGVGIVCFWNDSNVPFCFFSFRDGAELGFWTGS